MLPSINSLIATGFFVLIIVFLSIKHYKSLLQLNPVQKITVLASIATAIGIHGLLHLGTEQYYAFNPFNLFK